MSDRHPIRAALSDALHYFKIFNDDVFNKIDSLKAFDSAVRIGCLSK